MCFGWDSESPRRVSTNSVILLLLFPALPQGCSLATICGHLFNSMLVGEGYTWNRRAKRGEIPDIGHTLEMLLISHQNPFPTYEWLLCTDLCRSCLYQPVWLTKDWEIRNSYYIVIPKAMKTKWQERDRPGCFVCCYLDWKHKQPEFSMWSDEDLFFVWVGLVL